MSLIQEALKRKQEEADAAVVSDQTKSGAKPESAPPPPPPAVDEGDDEDESDGSTPSHSRTWLALLGVVVLLAFLLGGGATAVLYALRGLHTKAPAEPSEGPPPESVEATHTNDNTAAANLAQTSLAPISADAPALEVLRAPLTAGPTAPTSKPAPMPPAEPPPAVATTTQVTVVARNPPVKPVVWPRVELSGIAGGASKGSAILNNQIIGIGESLDGVKVLSVANGGVTLEYEGQRQVLRVGNSTKSAKTE